MHTCLCRLSKFTSFGYFSSFIGLFTYEGWCIRLSQHILQCFYTFSSYEDRIIWYFKKIPLTCRQQNGGYVRLGKMHLLLHIYSFPCSHTAPGITILNCRKYLIVCWMLVGPRGAWKNLEFTNTILHLVHGYEVKANIGKFLLSSLCTRYDFNGEIKFTVNVRGWAWFRWNAASTMSDIWGNAHDAHFVALI